MLLWLQESDNQSQCSICIAGSDLAISSTCSGSKVGSLTHTSGSHDDSPGHGSPQSAALLLQRAQDRTEAIGARDISWYVKKFEKGSRSRSLEHVDVKSSYCPCDYESSARAESLIFDSLTLKNRMEFGGLLLCSIRMFS